MSDSPDSAEVLRPSIPSLAWPIGAMWLGIVVAERQIWGAYAVGGTPGAGWACLAVVGLAALAGLVRWRTGIVVLCLVGLVSGVALGWLYWGRWLEDATTLATMRGQTWRLEVLADETVTQFGASSPCRVVGGALDGARISLQWPAGTAVPPLGRLVSVTGAAKAPPGDARGERSARAGVVGSIRGRSSRDVGWASSVRGVVGRVRLWAVARMSRVTGEGGALLSGVVVGDRRRLAGTPADTDFRTTGLTHLVAVSGSHLVVVAAVIGWMASIAGAGRARRSLLVAVVVGGYVVFSGVQPSAVRAWVMAVAGASAWLGGRRADGGSTLTVAAGVLLAVSPASAFDLGFQLSVAAVAGLVLFARLADSWLLAATGKSLGWIASPVALTLTATFTTIPITVSTFGMLSLVSPVANVVVGPLVSAALLIGLGGLAVHAVWASAGSLLLKLAAWPAAFAVRIAHEMAAWPYAAVPLGLSAAPAALGCAALGSLLWVMWPQPRRSTARWVLGALAALMVLVAVGPPVGSSPSIQVMDVGQGDAVLVRDGRHAVLVDAGPAVSPMREALARAGVRRLDAVVITHLHTDHYGGLGALKGVVRVPLVLVARGAGDSDSAALETARSLVGSEGVREIGVGSVLTVGRLRIDVVWPGAPVQDPASNAASVVLKVSESRFTAVLTGDAESEVLLPLVSSGQLGDIDVLKIGHHGSTGAVSAADLACAAT